MLGAGRLSTAVCSPARRRALAFTQLASAHMSRLHALNMESQFAHIGIVRRVPESTHAGQCVYCCLLTCSPKSSGAMNAGVPTSLCVRVSSGPISCQQRSDATVERGIGSMIVKQRRLDHNSSYIVSMSFVDRAYAIEGLLLCCDSRRKSK